MRVSASPGSWYLHLRAVGLCISRQLVYASPGSWCMRYLHLRAVGICISARRDACAAPCSRILLHQLLHTHTATPTAAYAYCYTNCCIRMQQFIHQLLHTRPHTIHPMYDTNVLANQYINTWTTACPHARHASTSPPRTLCRGSCWLPEYLYTNILVYILVC
jgi:hypothetical protein